MSESTTSTSFPGAGEVRGQGQMIDVNFDDLRERWRRRIMFPRWTKLIFYTVTVRYGLVSRSAVLRIRSHPFTVVLD